ncbi:unnamed protein product, partial [Pylaiella littoralis]
DHSGSVSYNHTYHTSDFPFVPYWVTIIGLPHVRMICTCTIWCIFVVGRSFLRRHCVCHRDSLAAHAQPVPIIMQARGSPGIDGTWSPTPGSISEYFYLV